LLTMFATNTLLSSEKTLPSFGNTASSNSAFTYVKSLLSVDISQSKRAATIKLRQNQLSTSQNIFLGDFGSEQGYFDLSEIKTFDSRMLKSDSRITFLFEMSEESILTTVQPAYSIISIVEGFGGFALVVICLGKFLVNGLTERLYQSELLEKFY
jgi:hypothetical protein